MTTETAKIKFHPNWLRIMYIVQIFIVLPLGLAILLAPDTMLPLLGWPAQEPILGAIGGASMMVAYGILSIAGLRSPLKFAPILLLQIVEKMGWLIVIAVPRLVAGTLPTFGIEASAIYVALIIGNLIVIPWKHIFAK